MVNPNRGWTVVHPGEGGGVLRYIIDGEVQWPFLRSTPFLGLELY